MSNINFSKREGDPLSHEEWNALGEEFHRLENKIEDSKGTKINFPNDSKKFLNGEGEFSVPTLKPITVNQNVTVVEDNEDAKVEASETNEGITLSFSLPKGAKGDTGKVYVPTVDEESGDLSWSLQNNPQEEIDSTNLKGPQGERGRGLDVNYSKSGKTTTVNITTDETTPELLKSFQISDGNDGHNPCLGRFASKPSSMPEGQVGDYIYVDTVQEGATITEIYHYTSNGWDENGTEVDISNETFDTGEKLHSVSIDESKLAHPASNALAKAEDVMPLAVKLDGVTAVEDKVLLGEEQDKAINGNNGELLTNGGHFVVNLISGTKRVRFLATEVANLSTYPYGYCFYSDSEGTIAIKSELYRLKTGSSNQSYDLVVKVPDDAVVFKFSVGSANRNSVYCYLQSGESVINMIDGLDKKINGEDISYLGDTNYGNSVNNGFKLSLVSQVEDVALKRNTSANCCKGIYVSSNTGKKYYIKTGSYKAYYAFWNTSTYEIYGSLGDKETKTLGDIKDYLCAIHKNGNDYVSMFEIEANTETYLTIPEDAKYMIFAGMTVDESGDAKKHIPSEIRLVIEEHIHGTIDELKEDIQELSNEIDTVNENAEENAINIETLNDELFGENQVVEEEAQFVTRKGSLDNNQFLTSTSSGNTINEISLDGIESAMITAQEDTYCVVFVSKSKLPTNGTYNVSTMRSTYMAVCDGFEPDTDKYRVFISANNVLNLTFNENCKYLYVSNKYSSAIRTPESIKLVSYKRVGGILSELTKEESNQGNALRLVIKDEKCFTAPIPCEKGFHLLVKDDYRITNAYLVDHLTGNIVNDDFIAYSISSVQNKAYRRCSNMCKMPGFDIVYQIEKLDGSIIESSSAVIEDFSIVEDLYTRKLPTGVEPSIYRAWRDKVQTSIGNVWIPSLQAANKIPQSHENDNPKIFGKGTTYIGVNYSGPTQWGKHVGMQVSMRTFKTAVANPRSVMYTEIIGSYKGKTAQSKYGYIHNSYGKEAGAFYGCVCTGLTSYLMGFPMVFQSSEWDSGSVDTKTDVVMLGTTSNPNVIYCNGNEYSYDSKEDCKALAELIQPMDFIWKDGHCAAISDVYVDEWGEVKYIVISEQTTPLSTSNAYTPEYFFLRFKNNVVRGNNWKILRRKSAWTIEDASIPRTNQDKEFVVMTNSQYNPEDIGAIDPDITTFAGEYAVFVIGNYSDTTNNFKMFLNIHRGGAEGYTHIQIFNEDDDENTATPVDEIDITSYQTDSSLGTNGYILPSDENEDWIIYNLAEYWRISQSNNTGKFKARVVRKESGSIIEGYVSGCTHFMMVAMSLNLNNSTINYTVKGAIPVVYECEDETGLYTGYSRYKNLVLDTDYTYNSETGEYTSIGTPLGSWTGAYLVLFANTDYGMANVKVAISNS